VFILYHNSIKCIILFQLGSHCHFPLSVSLKVTRIQVVRKLKQNNIQCKIMVSISQLDKNCVHYYEPENALYNIIMIEVYEI